MHTSFETNWISSSHEQVSDWNFFCEYPGCRHDLVIFRLTLYVLRVYMADADMEDYGFEYSDEEPEEQDVDIENQYYNTKGTC
jgi:hypothetical protein